METTDRHKIFHDPKAIQSERSVSAPFVTMLRFVSEPTRRGKKRHAGPFRLSNLSPLPLLDGRQWDRLTRHREDQEGGEGRQGQFYQQILLLPRLIHRRETKRTDTWENSVHHIAAQLTGRQKRSCHPL